MPLSILIYHRVLPKPDSLFPGEVDAIAFDQHLRLLTTFLKIIPLSDAVKGLRQGKLPARAACITFDDGYADNAEIALPILQRHKVTATFFVATGFLDGGRMWNDTIIEFVRQTRGDLLDLTKIGLGRFDISNAVRRSQTISSLLSQLKYLPPDARKRAVERICGNMQATLPSNLMMTSSQVRTLHNAGMEIGGHTVSHPILASMNPTDARSEISNGKETLESIIRAPVRMFAYPNGKPGQDYLSDHVSMVRDIGFDAAVSTAWGAAKRESDIHQLPRFTPWDRGGTKFILRMAHNMLRPTLTV